MLNIVTAGHPVLSQKTKEVVKFDKRLHEFVEQMKDTLIHTSDPIGVGLAANQVGLPLKLFIARENEETKIKVFINPIVLDRKEKIAPKPTSEQSKKQKPKKQLLEGCLSLPNIWGNVARENEITLSYQDEKGKKHKKTFKGFLATIIQHEMDHLNGALFTKRAMEQNEKLYRSSKNEKGEDEFEEISL